MNIFKLMIAMFGLQLIRSFHCEVSTKVGPFSIQFPGADISLPSKFLAHVNRETLMKENEKDFEFKPSTDMLILPCYAVGKEKETSCYDSELGFLVEFKTAVVCMKEMCYHLMDIVEGSINERYVNLKAADEENLRLLLTAEHKLNEEVRYNFGLLVQELKYTRDVLLQTILSVAKIDDQLIGVILNSRTRSQFITKNKFYLISDEEIGNEDFNCKEGIIFRKGRWSLKSNETQCINVTDSRLINLFKPKSLWFNEGEQSTLNKSRNYLDGWSAIIEEFNKLQIEVKTFGSTHKIQKQWEASTNPFKSVILIFIMIQFIAYITIIAGMVYLYNKMKRASTSFDPAYLRCEVMEPAPSAENSMQRGELSHILQRKMYGDKASLSGTL